MGLLFDFIDKTLAEGNQNNSSKKESREKSVFGLFSEEEKEMKNGDYEVFNFEEEELEDDDFYFEDDE